MSNSGRKMSTPGWRAFALLGGVLVVAFGAFASAPPQSKSEATLAPAVEQAGAAALIDQAGVVAVKPKAADTKQNSSLATSTAAAAGPSLTRSTAPLGVASAANLTEVQQPRGNRLTPMSGTSLSSDVTRSAQGGGCIVFNNKADFEAFNGEEGKLLKGIEDFEEMPPGTGIAGFDDPLCGGIPSNPPIFPNGIDQLNLCVQSNNLAGEADVPDPDGEDGLVFVEFGAGFGESSDIVVANNLVDSFDLMFGLPVPPDQQDNHTGVGFDPVTLLGGGTVAIRVFDKNNVEMVSATSPVGPAGSNFWGVWCPETIGRINIFDTGGGAQGADNIQMWLEEDVDECKDIEVVIPSCEEPPFKVIGDTTGAGNDSTCRDSDDFIITIDILEEGEYTFDLTANVDPCMWDSYMYLTSGDPCTCTDVVAFNDDCPSGGGCFGLSCIGPVTLEPGTYWIVVEGFSAADTGPVDLHVTSACVPPPVGNDNCEDRIEIFDGDTPIDTTQATTDGGDTNCTGDCCDFDDPQIHNDIWFNWDATCTGELTVSTCDMVDYDSKIAIYEDCDTGLCPRGGDEIGCNDDGPDCAGFSSIATADVVAGNCYKIRIGGFGDADRGTGTVELSCAPGPVCGDGVCDANEDECNCPEDCEGECACFTFDNKADFEAFNAEHGKILKGIEDFEEVPPGGDPIIGFPDPLCGGIPNPPFENGLDEDNLCVQANTLGAGGDVPSPHGDTGLVFVEFGAGFGENSDIVLANYFAESFDLMFGLPVPPDQQDNHTGVGFDAVSIFGGGFVDIRVFDKNNVEMESATAPANARGVFWGVWCPDTIGRINIFDIGGGAQGADNIQMWLEPDLGACCDHAQPDGQCTDGVPPTACIGPQLTFFADATCADVEAAGLCEEHTGACCDGTTGNCEDGVPESECPTGGGAATGPVGVVTEIKSDPLCELQELDVCNVYVHLDPPATKLLAVGSADITTDDPIGFFQHFADNADTSPLCDFVRLFPDLVCDSFVTFEKKCSDDNDTTSTECLFDSNAFNSGGQVAGGWFNFDVTNTQGLPDANGNVLVAQLSVRTGQSIGGIFTAYVQGPFGGTGSCPDLDGGGVGVTDLLKVIANCGPCPGGPCPWDFNGDGVVDNFDIAWLLGHWGNGCNKPPGFGAFDLIFDCFGQGDPDNQYRWEKDTLCDDLDPPCTEHTGACCDGTTGNCQDNVPESQCPVNPNDPNNQHRWEKDTLCANLDPPCTEHTGACCDGTTGNCFDFIPESECTGPQRRWEKDTLCSELDPLCREGLCDPDCVRDINGDGQIRAEDLAVLLGCWGPFPQGSVCECFDKDGDREIRAIDLASLLGSWGPCP